MTAEQEFITMTDKTYVLPLKDVWTLRVPLTDWDLLRTKVAAMPESAEWARNMAWAAVGVLAGAIVTLVGWFQVYRGMTPDVQQANSLFWIVYGSIAVGAAITAFAGFKLDETVREVRTWSKQNVLSDMDHIRAKHAEAPTTKPEVVKSA